MDKARKQKLEAAGWKVGSADDFLEAEQVEAPAGAPKPKPGSFHEWLEASQ